MSRPPVLLAEDHALVAPVCAALADLVTASSGSSVDVVDLFGAAKDHGVVGLRLGAFKRILRRAGYRVAAVAHGEAQHVHGLAYLSGGAA